MECIDNIALPTSTVRIPSFESIGPTVEPQDLKERFDTRHFQLSNNLHIIANLKFLYFPTLTLNKLLKEERANSIGSVALFSIGLDNHSSIYFGPVIFFVFRSIVGVDRMAHVRRHEKRSSDRLGMKGWRWREPLEERWDQGRLSTSGRHAANFFVVE